MNEDNNKSNDWAETFYHDLQTLVDTAFPKTCPKCGKVYIDKSAFLTETNPVRDLSLEDRSGLFSLENDRGAERVGLFRTCTCGTTLMADFQDRRDGTGAGQVQRGHFEKLMNMLIDKGMSARHSRQELLKVLHGNTSPLIDNLLGGLGTNSADQSRAG